MSAKVLDYRPPETRLIRVKNFFRSKRVRFCIKSGVFLVFLLAYTYGILLFVNFTLQYSRADIERKFLPYYSSSDMTVQFVKMNISIPRGIVLEYKINGAFTTQPVYWRLIPWGYIEAPPMCG